MTHGAPLLLLLLPQMWGLSLALLEHVGARPHKLLLLLRVLLRQRGDLVLQLLDLLQLHTHAAMPQAVSRRGATMAPRRCVRQPS